MAMIAKLDKSSKNFPKAETITITPVMAQNWLEESKFDNRNVSDRNVEKITRDIKAGKWIFDGNPIRFDKEGNVLDGQHRLWAIVTSGISVESSVIRGLEPEAKDVIDTGKSRTISDVLHFNGFKNSSVLSTCARIYIGYRTNGKDLNKWSTGNSAKKLSYNELLREVKTTSGFVEAVAAVLGNRVAMKQIGGGTAAFCFFIFHKIDSLAAYDFFYMLNTGVGLSEGSPILALRNWLVVKDYRGHKNSNVHTMMKIAVIIKSWNAYRKDKAVQRLFYNVEKEEFPRAE